MSTLKAIRIEKTKEAFLFEMKFGGSEEDPPVDKTNSNAVVNTAMSFMETKACLDEDLTDGLELAGEIHDTLEELQETDEPQPLKDDVAYQVGRDYARWGDELFNDPVKRDQLMAILEPFINGAIAKGGSLLKQVLIGILCNRFGVVSEIRIERIASLLLLVWNLFKTAVITYSVVKGFDILVKILKRVILFLQESHFFDKLKEIGGWEKLCQLVVAYKSKPYITAMITATPVKYCAVATVAGITGGIIVYFWMKSNK